MSRIARLPFSQGDIMTVTPAPLPMVRWFAILAAWSVAVCATVASAQPAAAPKLQPHVGPSKMYVVYTPADWNVSEDAAASSFQVLVESPSRSSRVEFRWERNTSERADAVAALAAWRKTVAQAYPGAVLSDMYVSKDGGHAVATLHARVASTAVAGHFFFESTRTGNSFQG
jgi:hypothetical protein